jgi:hypothetical protein
MSQELYEAITNRPIHQWGQVVCFEANSKTKTITEYGRTAILPFMDALNAYANIPNPASQLIQWTTEEEHIAAEAELQKNIKDPEWLEELFDCI